MAGTAHLQGLNRYPGKPTSGRYVYTYDDGCWYWQCDLCGAWGHETYDSMQGAFLECLIHAADCIDRPIRYEED